MPGVVIEHWRCARSDRVADPRSVPRRRHRQVTEDDPSDESRSSTGAICPGSTRSCLEVQTAEDQSPGLKDLHPVPANIRGSRVVSLTVRHQQGTTGLQTTGATKRTGAGRYVHNDVIARYINPQYRGVCAYVSASNVRQSRQWPARLRTRPASCASPRSRKAMETSPPRYPGGRRLGITKHQPPPS